MASDMTINRLQSVGSGGGGGGGRGPAGVQVGTARVGTGARQAGLIRVTARGHHKKIKK